MMFSMSTTDGRNQDNPERESLASIPRSAYLLPSTLDHLENSNWKLKISVNNVSV